jgi:CheY-like chemotaxis protein
MRLVDDLLDVERLTHGKISLVRRRVTLSEIVESAMESCKSLIDTSQHKLKINLPREPIVLNADATRLTQVFSNLLHNALKYTPDGGSIELSAERASSRINVKVQDTGIGISPEILPRLFEMYAQGEPLSGNEMKGLGVGLALVRQIVQLHGGSVTAQSEGINRGSQFIINLPLAEETEDTRKQAENRRAKPQKSTAGAGKRVLIVDDNRDASEALSMLLQRSGYVTKIFSDGTAALETAREFKPDAAVLDIGLPGMNGYDLARQLRNTFPKILLIALSGWRQDETAVHEAVFDNYLIKPAGVQELEKILSRL